MNKFLVISLVSIFSLRALAGNETHGGEIVFCQDLPAMEAAQKKQQEKEKAERKKNSNGDAQNDPWGIGPDNNMNGGWVGGDMTWDPKGLYTYTLWDYYENILYSSSPKLTIDMGPKESTYLEKVIFVLDRLSKFDKRRADRIRQRALSFDDQKSLVPPEVIKGLANDSNPMVNTESHCVRTTFAVQFANPKPFQSKYLVNTDFWKAADEETKAGLVLHEAVYADEIEAGAENSDGVRYFNAIISSTAMNLMTPEIYAVVVEKSLKHQ